jgi:hypothetical protein
MELLFLCLAAHDSEFRRWPDGVDRRICQTFAASPAEPGELPLGFSNSKYLVRGGESEIRTTNLAGRISLKLTINSVT